MVACARVIFVNSMSDLFHALVESSFIRDIFQLMEDTPRHTHQLLTKRPRRAARMAAELPWPGVRCQDRPERCLVRVGRSCADDDDSEAASWLEAVCAVDDVADLEVSERATPRTYTVKYTREVLAEYGAVARAGRGRAAAPRGSLLLW